MDPYRYPLVILLLMTFCSSVFSMGMYEDSFLWEETWGENSSFEVKKYWTNLNKYNKYEICAKFLGLPLTEVGMEEEVWPNRLYYTKDDYVQISYYLKCKNKANGQVSNCGFRIKEKGSDEVTYEQIFYHGTVSSNPNQLIFKLWPAGGEGLSRFFPE